VHTFHTYRNTNALGERHHKQVSPTRCLQFIKYVTITKPNLASCVKAIMIGRIPDRVDGIRDGSYISPMPREMTVYRRRIRNFVHTADHLESYVAAGWAQNIMRGSHQGLPALLLLVCTNVESLHFTSTDIGFYLNRVLKSTRRIIARSPNAENVPTPQETRPMPPLSALREVYHDASVKSSSVWRFDTVRLFQWPTLRSWTAQGVMGSYTITDEAAGSASLEHLELRASCITRHTICDMTKACSALRSFMYTREVREGADVDSEVTPRELAEALLHHSKSLESLKIDFGKDPKHHWSYSHAVFADMLSLKSLKIGAIELLGMPHEHRGAAPVRLAACLPGQLEYLEVVGCEEAHVGQVQEMLDVVSTGVRFNKLERIRLVFDDQKINHLTFQLRFGLPHPKVDFVFT
jgi:hypothetical protein